MWYMLRIFKGEIEMVVIGKMTGTCECSTTSTELDNKCPDQLSLLVIKTAVWKIAKTPLTESFDLEV